MKGVPAESSAAPRKATWFELYFDLAFVLCVAALTGRHVGEYTPEGALRFALQFLIVWTLWVAHTFWASGYDEDRIDQHLLGFLKILAILAIAYGAHMGSSHEAWFATGTGTFLLLMGLAFVRDALRGNDRKAAAVLGGLFGALGLAWVAAAASSGTNASWVWLALLAGGFASTLVLARDAEPQPHPEHMPERFGLFTIILLGEAVASSLHGLTHGEAVTQHALISALAGAMLSFLFWVAYFHRAKSANARIGQKHWMAHEVRRWVYAHVPLYLGIAGFSAGTVAIASHAHVDAGTAWMQAVAVAVAMVGLTLVGLASPDNAFEPRRVRANLGLALLTIPAALLLEPLGGQAVMVALVAFAGLQLAATFWWGRYV